MNRTRLQENYYRKLCRMVSAWLFSLTGEDHGAETVHEFLKRRFNGGKSTKGMTTIRYEEYLTEIYLYYVGLGLELPAPGTGGAVLHPRVHQEG